MSPKCRQDMKKSLIRFDVLLWALWSDGLIRYLIKSSEASCGRKIHLSNYRNNVNPTKQINVTTPNHNYLRGTLIMCLAVREPSIRLILQCKQNSCRPYTRDKK